MSEKQKIFLDIINTKHAIIKSQQINEPELSVEEKLAYLNDLYEHNLLKFIQTYYNYLNNTHVCELTRQVSVTVDKNDKKNELINYYLNRLKQESIEKKQMRVKNRRYEAMQRLIKTGDYFSDESMKAREPLLYKQMIEKYHTQTASPDTAHLYKCGTEEDIEPASGRRNYLTNFFMQHLENINYTDRINKIKQEQAQADNYEEEDTSSEEEAENEVEEEEEEDEEEEEKEEEEDKNIEMSTDQPVIMTNDEKLNIRNEFITIMQRKFLDGLDINFDYNSVDYNEDYDNVEIENRDEEEKYFDDVNSTTTTTKTIETAAVDLDDDADEELINDKTRTTKIKTKMNQFMQSSSLLKAQRTENFNAEYDY